MRRVAVGAGDLRAAASSGRFVVRELVPAGAPGVGDAAQPAGLAVDLSPPKKAPWHDPEALSSPTARKLHQRPTAVAVASVCGVLLSPGTRGRRLRLAVAATAALLMLLVCIRQRTSFPGRTEGLPGGEQQQQQQPADASAEKWRAHTALHSERGRHFAHQQQGRQQGAADKAAAGPVLVEFTAPGLYLTLSQALDLNHPHRPEEAPLLEALPHGEPAPPHLVAFAGRPSLEQVLQQRQQLQGISVSSSPAARAELAGPGNGSQGNAGERSSGTGKSNHSLLHNQAAVDLANAIQSELQQAEEAARRAQQEEEEAVSAAAQHQAAGDEGYQTAAAEVLRQAEGRQTLGQQPSAGTAAAASRLSGSSAGTGRGMRMLVGVTSACCSDTGLRRRAVVRETWAQTIREQYPNIDLRFFLAQPASAEAAAAWLLQLQEEVDRHNDTVVVRGEDSYLSLPNKTLRLMRYALAHPAGYTHVLKTDDDCYVRIHKVLEALQDVATELRGSVKMAAHGPRHRLPAMRQALLEQMARDGSPLHTDGIMLWNTSRLVASAGEMAERKYVDDAEGRPVTLAQMAKDAAAATRQHQVQLETEMVAEGSQGASGGASRQLLLVEPPLRMSGVYLGCLENKGGFFPIRDPSSKWYMSEAELPDSAVPFAVKYLAGWGYVLSRDLADHVVRKANLFQSRPEVAPAWFKPMHWEDVLMALLLMDVVGEPQDHASFRAAWRACPSTTALKHLDVDAPQLFRGLHEQEVSGLWDAKPVQCASGDFLPGDYSSWKAWRDSLPAVAHI